MTFNLQPSTPRGTAKPGVFVELLHIALTSLPDRSQTIVMARFGVEGGKKKTLEAIGREYGITRERVRQIVDVALKLVRKELEKREEASGMEDIARLIAERKGIVPVVSALDELAHDDERERGALLALLHSFPGTKIVKETTEREESVVSNDFSISHWKKIVTLAEEVFTEKNDVLTLPELLQEMRHRSPDETLDEMTLAHFLAPSTTITKSAFGRYGFASWSAVRPRGTRERAYLILKMTEKPLHFREIARLIDEYGLARVGKKTHPQTVHNELIKDKRFVLVGRGTYALEAWGYKPGTVREVLADILKHKAMPMTKEELLQAVLKVRRVKKSTVVINLNAFFTKVGKNVYTLGKS